MERKHFELNGGKMNTVLVIVSAFLALTAIAEGIILSVNACTGRTEPTVSESTVSSAEPAPAAPAEVSSLTVTAPIEYLAAGHTMALECVSEPAGLPVRWFSSDVSVATVDENGVVSALSAGTAAITAVSGDECSGVIMHVLEPGLIFLSPSMQDGNQYAVGKTTEREQAERIADFCRQRLELTGMEVFVCPYGKPLNQRDDLAAEKGAVCYVAIHSNAGGGGLRSGASAYYHNLSSDSVRLAAHLYDHVSALTPGDDTLGLINGMGHKSSKDGRMGYQEIRFPWLQGIPPVLLEVEFHDREETAQWIIDNVEPIGCAIADGILEYLAD